MKKTRVFAAAAVTLAAALLLTGCFGSNPTTPKPSATTSTPGTITANNGGNPSPVPSTTYSSTADPATPNGYLPYAQALFPKAQATAHYSKNDVLLALYSAYLYAERSQNSSYFISGAWAKDGYPESSVSAQYANVYTDSAMNQLLSYVASMTSDQKSGQNVFSAITFLPVGGSNYTVCAATAKSCQQDGFPKFTTGFSFAETSDGRLSVSFTIVSHITMTMNGTEGYLPITNEMTLYMKKNDSYKSQVGTYPYLVDGWSNNVTRSGFTK